MELEIIALHAAVLGAALLQAATGIGFGVLAGPVVLLVMDSGAAVQVTILLSFLIALVLSPGLWRQIDRALLGRLILGTLAGLPVGIFIFLQVSVDWLKLLAALAVLFMALTAAGVLGGDGRRNAERKDLAVGVLSGAMSAGLAMPGPVVAAHMAARAQSKTQIRATVLALFIVSYAAAFGLQLLLAGTERQTLDLTATLLPATLAGVLLGRLLADRVGERLFRRLIVVLLAATALGLLASALPNLVAA